MDFNLENEEQCAIPVVIIRCPVCKSEKITDISTYESNGIYGHGSRSWKISDMRSCDDCGVIFQACEGQWIITVCFIYGVICCFLFTYKLFLLFY